LYFSLAGKSTGTGLGFLWWFFILPQVVEMKPPLPMDAADAGPLYYVKGSQSHD
jgi:hypothetical protein